jgi:hypothetical protein
MASLSLPRDKAGRQKLLLAFIPLIVFFAYFQMMHGKKKAGDQEPRRESDRAQWRSRAAAEARAL